MIFVPLSLAGAYVIEPELKRDDRGFFTRTFCGDEFAERGLANEFVQSNLCFTEKRGVLRGMHYQLPPAAEAKLVRCSQGSILDVMIDLRVDSTTHCRWEAVRLDADTPKMVYVPEGFAHGYLTLTENCLVFYQVSQYYSPELERGVRWNDAAFGIEWPIDNPVVSERDNAHPDYLDCHVSTGGHAVQ